MAANEGGEPLTDTQMHINQLYKTNQVVTDKKQIRKNFNKSLLDQSAEHLYGGSEDASNYPTRPDLFTVLKQKNL